MGNHYHLVLETPEPNLGVGMRGFLSRFVQRSNQRHLTDGRMFKERYHATLVSGERHFACLLRYVALNPVNAGLCAEPGHWRWSGHANLLAHRHGPLSDVHRVEELLSCWGGAYGSRYAQLLAPESVFGTWSDAITPVPPRRPLAELLDALPLDEAMVAARFEHGYRLADIAAAVGLSESTVSRRTRR